MIALFRLHDEVVVVDNNGESDISRLGSIAALVLDAAYCYRCSVVCVSVCVC